MPFLVNSHRFAPPPAPPGGAEVVATDAFTSSGTISSTPVPIPAHLAGDIVLVLVGINTNSGTINTPAGWTQIGTTSQTSNINTAVFWRRAASDNEFGSTLNVTHSSFRRTSAVSAVVRGGSASVDPYGAMDDTIVPPVDAPDLTITGADTLLLALLAYRNTATFTISDADWVEDDFADPGTNDTSARIAHRTSLVPAGAYTGEEVWTSGFNSHNCWGVAIESA